MFVTVPSVQAMYEHKDSTLDRKLFLLLLLLLLLILAPPPLPLPQQCLVLNVLFPNQPNSSFHVDSARAIFYKNQLFALKYT